MSEIDETNIRTLDTSGLTCPEPVMLLHGAVRDAKIGECIRVIATDPSTERDVPKFCSFLGHELLKSERVGNLFTFDIVKGGASK